VQPVDAGKRLLDVRVVVVVERRRVHLDHELVAGQEHVADREDVDEVVDDRAGVTSERSVCWRHGR
jgi:hypothetical protein